MIAYGIVAGLAFFNCYWGGSYFVQWLPMVWLLVWLFFNCYWGGSYFVQWLPMVWLLVWLFSIVIEVVHILYNDCLWYSCWFGFFQLLLRWFIFCTMIAYGMTAGLAFFQLLLRWFIFCTMIAYGMTAGLAFFQLLLRWFIFCTMIAYGMIAGLAFFNCYWGGSYFVQWLPMVWLLVWLFSIVIEVVYILYNDCPWCVDDIKSFGLSMWSSRKRPMTYVYKIRPHGMLCRFLLKYLRLCMPEVCRW